MSTVDAIWENGQIVPTEPVDWPEGIVLSVEPIKEALFDESTGDLLGDDPPSIERWLARFHSPS
jgi:hypothetical protein